MSEGEDRMRRWLMPVGLTVLVLGLVVIALTRGPVDLDPDTPEGTVQEYLLAIHEERWEDAIEVVHPQSRGDCEADDLSVWADPDFTAELGSSNEFGGGVLREDFASIGTDADGPDIGLPGSDTTVDVTISRGDEGALGSGWTEFATFELLDEDDFWWISGDPWPYFVWNCRT